MKLISDFSTNVTVLCNVEEQTHTILLQDTVRCREEKCISLKCIKLQMLLIAQLFFNFLLSNCYSPTIIL